ncbi:MAG TPA: universal stress protein, partial [Chitinophagaceae bacterium]|nr:universal stress protein [Chitinophagaceae bacterium]
MAKIRIIPKNRFNKPNIIHDGLTAGQPIKNRVDMNLPARINNILFPTDFSTLSQNALNTAIAMCKRHNARLHLLHVVEPRFVPAPPDALTTAVYIMPGAEGIALDNMTKLSDMVKGNAFI